MTAVEHCRLCLRSTYLEPLFSNPLKCHRYERALYLSTGLQIRPNDGLPQTICSRCSQHVVNAMKFRSKSQEAEKKLLDLFKPHKHFTSKTDVEGNWKVDFKIENAELQKLHHPTLCSSPPLIDNNGLKEIGFTCNNNGNINIGRVNNNRSESASPHTGDAVPDQQSSRKESPLLEEVKSFQRNENKLQSDILSLRSESFLTGIKNVPSYNHESNQFKSFSPQNSDETYYLKKKTPKETLSRKRTLELVEGPVKPKQPMQCKMCKKICKSFNTFEKHAMSHLGYNILCEFCGKSCISTSSLLRHQRAKHGLEKDNSFPCSFCNFRAIDKEQLQVHERRLHTKERPYVCSDCGAGFYSRRVLKQHLVNHRDDKPYQCELCPSKFKLRCALTNHTKRVHDKINRKYTFGCHICHKTYCSTGDTRKHLTKVHGIPNTQQGKVHRFYFSQKNLLLSN